MKKVLVILGPTSTGKTGAALLLAKKFDGELVSCDSRQVYKGLDIGTGKAPGSEFKVQSVKLKIRKGKGYWEVNGVKIWMYDVVSPKRQYIVYDYVKDAERVINDILKRGKVPIIVGGTGLYLKALLEGIPNFDIPIDFKLRKKLEQLSLADLQKKLQEIYPQRWEKMNNSDRQNPRRLVRAIEIMQNSKLKTQRSKLQLKIQNFNILKIGLTAPRKMLYKKIDERVISRLDQGMIEEAEKLNKNGLSFKRMKQLGLEYGVLADYLEDKIKNREDLIQVLQGKIHGYARRQLTWFKNPSASSGSIHWFDISDKNYITELEKMVRKWYDDRAYAAEN